MKDDIKEMEMFGLVSLFIGIAIFIASCFWDVIAGRMLWHHNQGYGWEQIVTMSMSGLYSLWALTINRKWNEYQKKIHKLMRGY